MTAPFKTLQDRKRERLAAYRAGVERLADMLAAYARAHGGRFVLYGSAVHGPVHDQSDVDLIVDFPESGRSDACRFAEQSCSQLDLIGDIRPAIWTSDSLMARALGGCRCGHRLCERASSRRCVGLPVRQTCR